MALNLQTSPYYDDFDVDKNFHRILFKPGYAVQARELTQLQTILQEQIKRFGNFVLKDGTVVLGCAETFQFTVPYVKILTGSLTDAEYLAYANLYTGSIIENALGVSAKIVRFETSLAQRVLYLNYLTASINGLTTEFADNDVLSIETSTVTLTANSSDAVGVGSLFTLGDGLVYANGNFVRHVESTMVLDYFSSSPSKNVGFRIVETAVNSDDDATLLDPAAGSYNYAAPGADRYHLATSMESYEIEATPATGFHFLFIVEDGKVKRAFNTPQLGAIQKILAQRTFDESGNYSVTGLNVNIREHLNVDDNHGKYTAGAAGGLSSKLVYGIEPGKAYVEGYDTELKSTEYIAANKATDTDTYTEKLISTAFGNYVYVKSLAGSWSMGTDNLLVLLKDSGANTVATARVRLIKHHAGTPGTFATTFYKLHLHSVTPAGVYTTSDLSTIRTITDGANNTCTVAITPGDAITDVSQTEFKLHESSINSLIFPTTYRAISSFTNDTDYYYWKKFTVANINTTATISLAAGEQWVFANGSLSDSDIRQYFFVVNDTSHTPANFTGAAGDITVTTNNATFTLTSGSSHAHTVYALVSISNVSPIAVTLGRSWLKVSGASSFTGDSLTNFAVKKIYLGVSNVYDIEAIYSKTLVTGSGQEDEVLNIFPATDATLTDTQVISSTPAISAATGWDDVTSDFVLSKNINDNFYDTSFVTYTGPAVFTSKKYLIKFRYFSRSTNYGYLNKNSYSGCLIDADPLTPNTSISPEDEYNWISTYQLPVYRAQATGITYDIRDVIDFRPSAQNRTVGSDINDSGLILLNGSNISNTFDAVVVVPEPSREMTATFSYNLPRIDKIILTRDGEFKVVAGLSSLIPLPPSDQPHAMTLAEVHLAPYPSLSTYVAKQVGREDYSSVVRLADNRRYTMRDIGDLDHRINRLEYYAALSIMENKVANMVILDSSNLPMAKQGILVDNFDGHGVGNVFDSAYNAAIDATKKQLRPAFTLENIDFEVDGTSNTMGHLVLTGSSHTHQSFISNKYASKARTCGDAILGNFKNGIVVLDPPQDMWIDTNARPDVQSNYQGNNDGWEFDNLPFNIHWNGWQTIWQGVELTAVAPVTVTVVDGITGLRSYNQSTQLVSDVTRSTINTSKNPESNIRTIGVHVVDISVVPYVRPQLVTFIATGLLPNSIVQAYFDGEDVSSHCRKFTTLDNTDIANIKALKNSVLASTNTLSSYGDLQADDTGTILGQFLIPANKFRTGNKIFKLANNSTQAATQYCSSGIASINIDGINSTRFADIRQDALSTTQNAVIQRLVSNNSSSFDATSYGDPMAQTFIVEGEPDGVTVTKVDVYFKTKSDTQGITIQLREVVSGYPGKSIVPFSTITKISNDVTVSPDALEKTTFTFNSPVYLKNNTEYALVLIPENNTTDYEVWVSELGQNQYGTLEKITQQSLVGSLFVPNNNTLWTKLTAEDLKFTLHRGVFSTAETTVNLKSAPIDYITFAANNAAHTLVPGDVIVTTVGAKTGVITEVVNNTAKIYVTAGPFVTGHIFSVEGTTFTIASIDNKVITALAPNFGTLAVAPTTTVSLKYQLRNSSKVLQTLTQLKNMETVELSAPHTVFSYSNNSSYPAILMQAVIKTATASISPVLDTKKLSMTTVTNNLSNVLIIPTANIATATETITYTAHGLIVGDAVVYRNGGGTSAAGLADGNTYFVIATGLTANVFKVSATPGGSAVNITGTGNSAQYFQKSGVYVTRNVTLDSAALDLRVYLDVKLTEQTAVAVYVKLQRPGDDSSMHDVAWKLLTTVTPRTPNRAVFQEYSYKMSNLVIPTSAIAV